MITMELVTVAIRPDGCFSVLKDFAGRPFAVTVERTFEHGEVVIKQGMHRCRRSRFHRGGYDTFEIDVEGHSRVLFHKGNTELDSTACVIVGESFGELNNATAVLDSKGGFGEFMRLTGGLAEFYLNVLGRP